MRRWLTFVAALALAVALGGVVSRVPRALSEVEAFRVTEIRLRGGRFLSLEAAVEALALPEGASVWDDTRAWEARLLAHPLVEHVSIHRRFPNALLLRVKEVEPVGLAPNPTLVPVDARGRILPVDPVAHKLDLPVMLVEDHEESAESAPTGLRVLASELQRLTQGAPDLSTRISDLSVSRRGDVRARLSDPPVTLRFRPGVRHGRIDTGLRVLADVRARFQTTQPVDVDLRFDGWVVVRPSGTEGS